MMSRLKGGKVLLQERTFQFLQTWLARTISSRQLRFDSRDSIPQARPVRKLATCTSESLVNKVKRTLSSEELQREKSLSSCLEELEESDTFGKLTHSKRRKKRRDGISKNGDSVGHVEENPMRMEKSAVHERKPVPSLTSRLKGSVGDVEGHDKDADEFGTLAQDFDAGPSTETGISEGADKGDGDYHRPLSPFNRRHHQNWYERRIARFAKNGQVLEALDFLEKVMIERDRVMPTAFAYTVVIDAMAKYGYPEGAFKLFRKMVVRGLKPFDQTYTALFNACANCPDKAVGLRYARRFRETLAKKEILPNRTTYKAMMKVYAMCGDVETFSLADELHEKRGRIDDETFSHLLMYAISDTNAGFKHALEVFHSLRQHGLKADLYHYNLLLRTIRDCGIGEQEFSVELINNFRKNMLPSNIQIKELGKSSENVEHENSEERLSEMAMLGVGHSAVGGQNETHTTNAEVQPLLSSDTASVTVNVAEVKTTLDRFNLLGGLPGVLGAMQQDGTKPDVKTFTLLLDVVPSLTEVEDLLILAMQKIDVTPDTTFFNMVMRRRVFRNDFMAAWAVVDCLTERQLTPDEKTFGVLALTCREKSNAFTLLKDMEHYGIEPTSEIFSHLVKASSMDFDYKWKLCLELKRRGLKPTEKFLHHIEKDVQKGKKYRIAKERGEKVPRYARSTKFDSHLSNFILKYKTWLQTLEVVKPQSYKDMFVDSREKTETLTG